MFQGGLSKDKQPLEQPRVGKANLFIFRQISRWRLLKTCVSLPSTSLCYLYLSAYEAFFKLIAGSRAQVSHPVK